MTVKVQLSEEKIIQKAMENLVKQGELRRAAVILAKSLAYYETMARECCDVEACEKEIGRKMKQGELIDEIATEAKDCMRVAGPLLDLFKKLKGIE